MGMLQKKIWSAWRQYTEVTMNINMELIPKSIIFDIAAMGIRLVPVGKQRTFEDGEKLYKLFCILYNDVHPEVTENDFFKILRKIFPVYKNPRKNTDNYKITTFKLKERLNELGMSRFPMDAFNNMENLKIEM